MKSIDYAILGLAIGTLIGILNIDITISLIVILVIWLLLGVWMFKEFIKKSYWMFKRAGRGVR